MRKRKRSGNAILRACIVAVSILMQAGWLLTVILLLNEYSAWISLFTSLLSAVVVLKLYSKHTNAAMKMPWIMLIMAFPVMGLCMYLLIELLGDPGVGKRLREVRNDMKDNLVQKPDVLTRLDSRDKSVANQFRYLMNAVGAPVYDNTHAVYYGEAVDAFEAMKQELEKAERFIFMEYFIVEDGSAFREIQDILIRKKQQGVEVRLLYDDIGSVGYVNMRFAYRLNAAGIRCIPFNPAVPILNVFMNHRDHRKITVIDGKVAFTGGYNLADAYFDRETALWKMEGYRSETGRRGSPESDGFVSADVVHLQPGAGRFHTVSERILQRQIRRICAALW